MSDLNDRDLMKYALKEALVREKHLSVKLKAYYHSTRDTRLKNLCAELVNDCTARINILRREMDNLYINRE